jgi:hypothetical protein
VIGRSYVVAPRPLRVMVDGLAAPCWLVRRLGRRQGARPLDEASGESYLRLRAAERVRRA